MACKLSTVLCRLPLRVVDSVGCSCRPGTGGGCCWAAAGLKGCCAVVSDCAAGACTGASARRGDVGDVEPAAAISPAADDDRDSDEDVRLA